MRGGHLSEWEHLELKEIVELSVLIFPSNVPRGGECHVRSCVAKGQSRGLL